MARILKFELKEYRKRNGLTQKDVSEKTGLTQSAISQFENNADKVTLPTINFIADRLEIDAIELISANNPPVELWRELEDLKYKAKVYKANLENFSIRLGVYEHKLFKMEDEK